MAGGTAGKGSALYSTALAKIELAKQAIQQLSQSGGPAGDPRHTVSDPAIVAAITALQAIQ